MITAFPERQLGDASSTNSARAPRLEIERRQATMKHQAITNTTTPHVRPRRATSARASTKTRGTSSQRPRYQRERAPRLCSSRSAPIESTTATIVVYRIGKIFLRLHPDGVRHPRVLTPVPRSRARIHKNPRPTQEPGGEQNLDRTSKGGRGRSIGEWRVVEMKHDIFCGGR